MLNVGTARPGSVEVPVEVEVEHLAVLPAVLRARLVAVAAVACVEATAFRKDVQWPTFMETNTIEEPLSLECLTTVGDQWSELGDSSHRVE